MADTDDSREKIKADGRAYMRARYVANPEEFRERSRAWRAANPEKAKEASRKNDAKRSGQPRYIYKGHKTSAKQRGVEFLLTFDEWWSIWEGSGKWGQRGRETGRYVMARFGDAGPYAVGNVRICTSQQNNSEAHRGKQVGEATRKRLSEVAKARMQSAETRKKVSDGLKAYYARASHLRPP